MHFLRFPLAIGRSGEHRGSGRGRSRSTTARGLVLPPPEQSGGGRCRVRRGTGEGHAAWELAVSREQWKKRKDDVLGVCTCIALAFSDDCEAYGRGISECFL